MDHSRCDGFPPKRPKPARSPCLASSVPSRAPRRSRSGSPPQINRNGVPWTRHNSARATWPVPMVKSVDAPRIIAMFVQFQDFLDGDLSSCFFPLPGVSPQLRPRHRSSSWMLPQQCCGSLMAPPATGGGHAPVTCFRSIRKKEKCHKPAIF